MGFIDDDEKYYYTQLQGADKSKCYELAKAEYPLPSIFYDELSKRRNENRHCSNKYSIRRHTLDLLSDDQIIMYKDDGVIYCFAIDDIDHILPDGINPFTKKPLSDTFIDQLKALKQDKRYKYQIDNLDRAYKRTFGLKLVSAPFLRADRGTRKPPTLAPRKPPSVIKPPTFVPRKTPVIKPPPMKGLNTSIGVSTPIPPSMKGLDTSTSTSTSTSTPYRGPRKERTYRIVPRTRRENVIYEPKEPLDESINLEPNPPVSKYQDESSINQRLSHLAPEGPPKPLPLRTLIPEELRDLNSSSIYSLPILPEPRYEKDYGSYTSRIRKVLEGIYLGNISKEEGNADIISMLSKHSNDIDTSSVLNWAILRDNVDMVRYLIDNNWVDPDLDNINLIRYSMVLPENSPFSLEYIYYIAYDLSFIGKAAELGYLDMIQYLMTLPGAEANINDNEPIIRAAQNGHLEIVKYLLTLPGVIPSAREDEPIIRAAEYGHLDVVEYLGSLSNVYPGNRDSEALIKAAEYGHLDIVKYLYSLPDVDPTGKDNEAIIKASEYGHLDIVKYLTTLPEKKTPWTPWRPTIAKVDPAARDNESIVQAAKNGHLDVVEYLFSLPGVDATVRDNIAIILAEEYGHLDVADYLRSRLDTLE